MSRSWDIVGIDLISDVSCKFPYEWVDKTDPEWDFNSNSRDGETYRVSILLYFSLVLVLMILSTNFLLSTFSERLLLMTLASSITS